jgi:hypothetical protein
LNEIKVVEFLVDRDSFTVDERQLFEKCHHLKSESLKILWLTQDSIESCNVPTVLIKKEHKKIPDPMVSFDYAANYVYIDGDETNGFTFTDMIGRKTDLSETDIIQAESRKKKGCY